ncbi:MAG: 5'-nucleotidase C-terminal domain-containing protein [Ignavibacteria bacterium]|jgi:5'-nucleotidase|nr:5'-nucleotidase C-terminal domain-containing protein [Ignavibacteria bacterium]
MPNYLKHTAINFFWLAVCILLLIGCESNSTATQNPIGKKVAIILHTNDVHGAYSFVDAISGGPTSAIGHDYIAGVYDAFKQKYNVPVFLLDAGDATQGIYFVAQSKGQSAIEIMNSTGYDAMTLGNHEFDYGWLHLIENSKKANFAWLTQIAEANNTNNLYHYIVLQRDSIRLGVFGITTPETQFTSEGGFDITFGSVNDLIQYSKQMVALLRDSFYVDYVVCLSHLGINDFGYGTSYNIRDNVEGIDIIIDGHSHTELKDIVNVSGKTPITSTGTASVQLGVVNLFDAGIPETLNMPKNECFTYTPRASVTDVIGKWIAIVKNEGSVIVATLPFDITTLKANERTRETIMGNIITDAMRIASGADIAIQNGGSIRDQQLKAGQITKSQLINIMPYGNILQKATISGKILLEVLEQSVSLYPSENGGFMQCSGMTYTFNPNKPVGSRIIKVTIAGKPLDTNALYTLCTNDYIAKGGDNYKMLISTFKNQQSLAIPELALMEEAVIWYLKANQTTISPNLEGRIIVINE